MRECYHAACDSVRAGHSGDFADLAFYEHTVRAVARAVSDVAGKVLSITIEIHSIN